VEDSSNYGGTEVLGNSKSNRPKDDDKPSQGDDNQHSGLHQTVEVGDAGRDEMVRDEKVQCDQHRFFLQVMMKCIYVSANWR